MNKIPDFQSFSESLNEGRGKTIFVTHYSDGKPTTREGVLAYFLRRALGIHATAPLPGSKGRYDRTAKIGEGPSYDFDPKLIAKDILKIAQARTDDYFSNK